MRYALDMLRLASAAALVASCATLSTGKMSPACRDTYDRCLNTCEQDAPSIDPGPPMNPSTVAPRDVGPLGYGSAKPACVDACKRQATTCSENERIRLSSPP